MAETAKQMSIVTSYTVPIRGQILPSGKASGVNNKLMEQTAKLCLEALSFCTDVYLGHWPELSALKPGERKSAAENLIHSTKTIDAVYPEFDERFCCMPTGIRRAIRSKALGVVSSYVSNRKNWEESLTSEQGKEPTLGLPSRYELTFYKTEHNVETLSDGQIKLKLYSGSSWEWYTFTLRPSDARKIADLASRRKMLSPVVEKVHGKYRLRFSFEEKKTLVQNENPLLYRILAVDLGINAAASWCVMESDGTVHARGVIHERVEEDRLCHAINRQRGYAAKHKHGIADRNVRYCNEALSIATAKSINDIAVLYNVDCIAFEHLDKSGKTKGGSKRARIHYWRANDVQRRVETMAHRAGMRISRICAWGTSKLAFDGSGKVIRSSANYSICAFPSGKQYNCDISASLNIGARFFLRLYTEDPDVKAVIPATPQRTYHTLLSVIEKGSLMAA